MPPIGLRAAPTASTLHRGADTDRPLQRAYGREPLMAAAPHIQKYVEFRSKIQGATAMPGGKGWWPTSQSPRFQRV
jgi:hypothetical protein